MKEYHYMTNDHPNRPDHPLLAFFPESLIQLNKEIAKHTKLIELLSNHPAPEWEIRLAQVCQYCGIAINGIFDAEGIDYIAEQCIKRLRMRERNKVIESSEAPVVPIVTEDIEPPPIITTPKLLH